MMDYLPFITMIRAKREKERHVRSRPILARKVVSDRTNNAIRSTVLDGCNDIGRSISSTGRGIRRSVLTIAVANGVGRVLNIPVANDGTHPGGSALAIWVASDRTHHALRSTALDGRKVISSLTVGSRRAARGTVGTRRAFSGSALAIRVASDRTHHALRSTALDGRKVAGTRIAQFPIRIIVTSGHCGVGLVPD
jgi:hypothetical protein